MKEIKGSVSSDESEFKLNFNSPELILYENYLSKVKMLSCIVGLAI